ncbi:MAG: hypothetical protein IJ489_00040 [Clostridia bacterium]|nr:hypothetical protein [Clostridia bacterium]
MKKIISILLFLAMLVSFASCHTSDIEETSSSTATTDTTETTDTSETVIPEKFFKVPDDEKEVTCVIKSEKDYGLKMEVTLHGYQSESLNKDFYVKNNEYFIVDVKIINDSPTSDKILQFMSTDCRTFDPPHNHELEFYFANRYGDHLAVSSDYRSLAHPERYIIWELKPGESETYTLKLAAGKHTENSKEYDLLYDGREGGGIELYDESIYENGSCLFIGYIYFPHAFDDNKGLDTRNNLYIATELSFEVVYVSDETTETMDTTETTDTTETSDTAETVIPEVFFEVPSDEKEVTKTIVTENTDGMKMELTLHGYASESLEKDFYVKHNEVVTMDVKITNTSDHTNRQFLPTYCRESGLGDYRHNHEITVDITNANGIELTSCAVYGGCPEMYDMWDIEAGESYDFKLEYVAGKVYYDERDDAPKLCDIPLYGNEIYPNGTCDFTGTISFVYCENYEEDQIRGANDLSLSADIAFTIVYVH